MRDRLLTPLQEQVLGYVDAEGPVSVADVAGSMMVSASSARSALESLGRRGLVEAQHTGHHRGRGQAFVTNDRGATKAADVFGADDEGSDEPLPVKIVVYRGPMYIRIGGGLLRRRERDLMWADLLPAERAAVDQARNEGGSATLGHVTVVPGMRMGVVEEWWT